MKGNPSGDLIWTQIFLMFSVTNIFLFRLQHLIDCSPGRLCHFSFLQVIINTCIRYLEINCYVCREMRCLRHKIHVGLFLSLILTDIAWIFVAFIQVSSKFQSQYFINIIHYTLIWRHMPLNILTFLFYISDFHSECPWSALRLRECDHSLVSQPRGSQILPPHNILLDVFGR